MRILAILCALIFCAIAYARQPRAVGDLISGPATTVVDGDTFRIVYDRIRI